MPTNARIRSRAGPSESRKKATAIEVSEKTEIQRGHEEWARPSPDNQSIKPRKRKTIPPLELEKKKSAPALMAKAAAPAAIAAQHRLFQPVAMMPGHRIQPVTRKVAVWFRLGKNPNPARVYPFSSKNGYFQPVEDAYTANPA